MEQFAVGAVAHDHQSLWQQLPHTDTALLVPVDDLHIHSHLDQFGSQIIADLAGAHDDDRIGPGPEHPQVPEKLLQLAGRRGEVDLVAGTQLEVAGGDDGLLLSGHGADQDPDLEAAVQVRKTHSVQLAVLRQAVLHQLQPALGKGLQLHGGWEAEHTGDLTGSGLLRVDGHGEAQLRAHEAQLLFILRIADAGNGVVHAQLLGHKAGQNVDLVAGGGGNQQIGMSHVRLLLHLVAGAVAAYPHDVVYINNILHQLVIFVHHGDLVVHRQLLGQRQANLPDAHDDDFHVFVPILYRSHFQPQQFCCGGGPQWAYDAL